ncbi:hypothetical protein MKK68_02300 [Methylobacterium sp. E-016]|uniref:hypothetical protein n=1 Tax=Methylobacterium sp. E-016 TaxID=2836556 RepID=UPI001FBC02F5|nr:hypothetical protein [Methylobacterium sp. E-016]MCJ2074491.1 hypothetical protein [Methylobacterium sp. E-016]
MSKKSGTIGTRSTVTGHYSSGKTIVIRSGEPMTQARIARVRDALALASEKTGEFRPSPHAPVKRDAAK